MAKHAHKLEVSVLDERKKTKFCVESNELAFIYASVSKVGGYERNA